MKLLNRKIPKDYIFFAILMFVSISCSVKNKKLMDRDVPQETKEVVEQPKEAEEATEGDEPKKVRPKTEIVIPDRALEGGVPAPEGEREIFKVVEEMPRFPGCEDSGLDKQAKMKCSEEKLVAWFYANLNYPTEARANKTEGNVYVQFVINEEGKVVEPNVVREIGSGCGDAALKVFEKMTNEITWVPGKQRGRPVEVLFTFPVKFRLAK